jgi:hypothetical protein
MRTIEQLQQQVAQLRQQQTTAAAAVDQDRQHLNQALAALEQRCNAQKMELRSVNKLLDEERLHRQRLQQLNESISKAPVIVASNSHQPSIATAAITGATIASSSPSERVDSLSAQLLAERAENDRLKVQLQDVQRFNSQEHERTLKASEQQQRQLLQVERRQRLENELHQYQNQRYQMVQMSSSFSFRFLISLSRSKTGKRLART